MKYNIEVLFGDIVIANIPTKPERYATDAFEVVPIKVLGEDGRGRHWKIVDHDDENHKAWFTDGKNVVHTRLIRFGEVVSDFDEADKPEKSARFTVFAGGNPVSCNNVDEMAKALSRIIFGRNKVQIS